MFWMDVLTDKQTVSLKALRQTVKLVLIHWTTSDADTDAQQEKRRKYEKRVSLISLPNTTATAPVLESLLLLLLLYNLQTDER